jgi:hypothetical protein
VNFGCAFTATPPQQKKKQQCVGLCTRTHLTDADIQTDVQQELSSLRSYRPIKFVTEDRIKRKRVTVAKPL